MQRGVRVEALAQQHDERADHAGWPIEPLAHAAQLRLQVAVEIGDGLVLRVAGIEHGVQQLLLGGEMVQEARRAHPGGPGDLAERCRPASARRHHAQRHLKYVLPAVLALGEQRLVGTAHTLLTSPRFFVVVSQMPLTGAPSPC